MIREDRFVISHRPYAVDLASLAKTGHGSYEVTAIWFRRRKGDTVAVFGQLWDCQSAAPASVADFLRAHNDGRYGGRAAARWDGDSLWSPETSFEVAKIRQAVLANALANFPDIPPGYDGWWTFRD